MATLRVFEKVVMFVVLKGRDNYVDSDGFSQGYNPQTWTLAVQMDVACFNYFKRFALPSEHLNSLLVSVFAVFTISRLY